MIKLFEYRAYEFENIVLKGIMLRSTVVPEREGKYSDTGNKIAKFKREDNELKTTYHSRK